MSVIVTTLFESGHYEEGAAALLNSLERSGFNGRVWCGVRNLSKSRLAKQIARQGDNSRMHVQFVDITCDYHLTYHKPRFMLDVAGWDSAQALVYFDPDIVVKCSWPFVAEWCSQGIATVADVNWNMPHQHPVRNSWRALRARLGIDAFPTEAPGPLDYYCNAGFIGLPIAQCDFLRLWADLIDAIRASEIDNFSTGGAYDLHGAVDDQVLFNLALMSFGQNVMPMEPAAMDFVSGGRVFSHAIGVPKPWNRKYVRMALKGYPPSKRDQEFLRHAYGNIMLVSSRQLRRRLAAYKAARLIGSVFKREDY